MVDQILGSACQHGYLEGQQTSVCNSNSHRGSHSKTVEYETGIKIWTSLHIPFETKSVGMELRVILNPRYVDVLPLDSNTNPMISVSENHWMLGSDSLSGHCDTTPLKG